MELADLVRLVNRLKAFTLQAHQRPLLTIVILGTALYAVTRFEVEAPVDRMPLVVSVQEQASDDDVERATDNAVLLAFAERAGFVHRDAAIRARLELNVRFVDPTLEGDAAIDEAMRLQMHQSDPVVHARLLWLARETLASATQREPSRAELQAYMQQHRDRFAQPATLSFEQIFVRHDRVDFDERLAMVREAPALELSDASLLPATMENASHRRIDARFGVGFAQRVAESSEWERVDSTFGAHLVRITARDDATLPALDAIETRVAHEWEQDDRPRRVRQALARMRAAYSIEVERS